MGGEGTFHFMDPPAHIYTPILPSLPLTCHLFTMVSRHRHTQTHTHTHAHTHTHTHTYTHTRTHTHIHKELESTLKRKCSCRRINKDSDTNFGEIEALKGTEFHSQVLPKEPFQSRPQSEESEQSDLLPLNCLLTSFLSPVLESTP